MSTNLDLNALRATILANQNAGTTRPSDPAKTVTVDREGKIGLGAQHANPTGPLSTVPQETFANRQETDRAIARQFMPSNTREFVLKEGVTGYSYAFKTEFGDEFVLFAYFDGASYQVRVLEPKIEERFRSAHTGHLFSDGRICFGANYGNGMPTLRDAYAKSVLWANGMSVAMRTELFPYSNNNT